MIAFLALIVWLYLFFAHGRFWSSEPQLWAQMPPSCPDIDIVVPARDEAQTIRPAIESLLAQDYPGKFRVILVDDNSGDGTAQCAGTAANLTILSLRSKPAGWSGKLWALGQGIAAGGAPILLFTDADIVHDPRHLSSLAAKLLQSGTDMVSEMVRLNCRSVAERALVPAFVYFFQMLYPFRRVNDPHSPLAAAAGGTILIRREALQRIGGIESIKDSLIDDVALARAVKRTGGIFLGHSGLAASIRPYPHFGDILRMISRTAFTQLRHSALLLMLTLFGLTVVWLVPMAAVLLARGWAFAFGLAAFALSALSYFPTLVRYGRNPMWALALPLIALFYMAATLSSALNFWLGRGARWKSRDYGQ
ncbi:MAG TPA: glycosyltransferase [Steroidobacteraceae bacterium]|nr:glycosyltransferase [Steroidobacteraceae bacterium]